MNPFIQSLSEKGVQVHDFPISHVDSKCGQEWLDHGSCCEIESLREYAKNDSSLIVSSLSKYKNSVFQIASVFFRLMSHSNENPHYDIPELNNLTSVLRELSRKNSYGVLEEIVRDRTAFDSAATRCWAEMSRVRSVSLCSICSARSSEFFEAGKALVMPEVCQAVIESCDDFFSRIRSFFSSVKFIEEATKVYLARVMDQESFDSQFAILEEFKKAMMDAKICQAVKAYVDNNKSSNSPQEAALCGKLLRIYDTPFVAISGAFLKVVNEKLDILETSINRHRDLQTRMLKRTRRLSQLHSNFEFDQLLLAPQQTVTTNLDTSLIQHSLEGDVKMVLPVEAKIDSSYTSYFGANGTAGNEVSSHMKHMPVNLTMLFP